MNTNKLDALKDFTKEYIRYGKHTYKWADSFVENRLDLLETCKDLYSIVCVIGKDDTLYYLDALHKKNIVSEQEIADVLYARWTQLEMFYDMGMSTIKLLKFMQIADKSSGQLNIKYMPKTIKIYRGVHVEDYQGLSWTRNKKVAEWFAKRYLSNGDSGYVFSGELTREDIIAKFNNRKESEVICDWRKVKNITCEKVLVSDKKMEDIQ